MKPNLIKRLLACLLLPLLCATGGTLRAAGAVCAQVQIRIEQKLTMTRTGFEATMQVANGLPDKALENFNVELLFTDADGNAVSGTTSTTATDTVFWYRVQTGSPSVPTTINGGETETFKWLIVPSAKAAQGSPQGVRYFTGATVSYKVNGVEQTAEVAPDYVQVYPAPVLELA